MMIRAGILAIALALTPASSLAAEFSARIWQSEEGLPGNVVRSIGQTADGYLWIATAEGIAHFNGLEFSTYRTRELEAYRIFTPTAEGVWISSYRGGLFRMGPDGPQTIIKGTDQVTPPLITHLISFQKEIYFLQGQEIRTIRQNKSELITTPSPELQQALDQDFAKQKKRGRHLKNQRPQRLTDRSGGHWQISGQSLHYQAAGEKTYQLALPELQKRIIANDLLEDREGNLWIASPVQGLIRVREDRIQQLKTNNLPYVTAVQTSLQAADGTWWIGKRNGGVDQIVNGQITHHDLTEGDYPRPITCIYQDRKNRLWFAARDGTVFEWINEQFKARFSRDQTITKVNSMVEDPSGALWFGGAQGLFHWDGEKVTKQEKLDQLNISTLALAADGSILAGTHAGHLLSIKDSSVTELISPENLNHRWISTILPRGKDEIWIATLGSGLFLLKDQKLSHFGAEASIPDERLTSLANHRDDQFWIGSLGGILSVPRSQLLEHRNDPKQIPGWIRLDRSDGLLNRECVGGSHPGVTIDTQGSFWFPTASGLAGIDPTTFKSESTPPILHFQQIKINGRPHPFTEQAIEAGPGKTSLSISFIAVNLSAPEKVSYRIQLTGYDAAPRFIGAQREITYDSLPPGKYQFSVSAQNGDGKSTISPSTISILVKPHFSQTTTFLVISIASILAITLAIGAILARKRLNQKLQTLHLKNVLENERARISTDLHDDLGASLTELSLLSALATEDPDDTTLRPALHQLSHKAKHVVTTLDEIVWATTPREDSLRSLVEYLAAFAREFLDHSEINLRTKIERNIPDHKIGPRRRHNVLLATREALNNAVKHSKAETIHLHVTLSHSHLSVTIHDDGKGFLVEEQDPSGQGLKNLAKRLHNCGGDFQITSKPGKGTTVTLTLPIPSAT